MAKNKSGILIINKQKGMTSFDVVFKLRKLLGIKKIGHTGTLDPEAEGVLPVCVGKATKAVDLMSGMTKTYKACLRLGLVTDTQDLTGTILEEHPVAVTEDELKEIILSFQGDRMQIPPMYSAVKVGGRKLVDLARKGVTIEREPRPVTFSEIRIRSVCLPEAVFEVTCSKGAYIRTLCHDIGQKAGCGAAMVSLTRTRVGPFCLKDARTLDELKDCLSDPGVFLSVDSLFPDTPAVRSKGLSADKALLNGCDLTTEDAFAENETADGKRCRVYLSNGEFVGFYRFDRSGDRFKLEKFFYDLSDGTGSV